MKLVNQKINVLIFAFFLGYFGLQVGGFWGGAMFIGAISSVGFCLWVERYRA